MPVDAFLETIKGFRRNLNFFSLSLPRSSVPGVGITSDFFLRLRIHVYLPENTGTGTFMLLPDLHVVLSVKNRPGNLFFANVLISDVGPPQA